MFISKMSWNRSRTNQIDALEGYQTHQLVWQLFSHSPTQERDFIYRQEFREGLPLIYVVSAQEPQEHANWQIETKDYRPQLSAGQRLAFMVRVNPVIKKRDPAKKHADKHDIVMDLKKRLPKANWPALGELVQQAGIEWLTKQSVAHGFHFKPEAISVEGYQQLTLPHRGQSGIQLSTLEFTGVLNVTDAEKFVQMLYQGLGSAKAFGCGLMLVRKV